ncbi:hypothetical protein B566_EDAN005504 [Ephemera danica]|nr:hypothetical protein B566_EDAN005504 [Ephemera danica]
MQRPAGVYRAKAKVSAMQFLLVLAILAVPPTVLGRLIEQYAWRQVDFTFNNDSHREEALRSGAYNPAKALPLGIARYGERVFVSLPKWKSGTPATLATVPASNDGNQSPLLTPYPDWTWHGRPDGDCDGLTSVFRMEADQCGRLWVLDAGLINVAEGGKQACPPQLFIFDLKSDTLMRKYRFPQSSLKSNSFLTGITLDVDGTMCSSQEDDAFAYIADVWAFGMVVYSFKQDKSWRVEHEYFHPDPLACKFNATGISFRWLDGLFGIALSPLNREDPTAVRTMYFHPMSSYREFSVPTSVIRNETAAGDSADAFTVYEKRGRTLSHASASAMSAQGILLYNLVSKDAVGCWNTRVPHIEALQGIIDQDPVRLSLPNDITVDLDDNVWVLSDRLHKYLYQNLDPNDVNFRVLTAKVTDVVRGTVCDPERQHDPSVLAPRKPECNEDL